MCFKLGAEGNEVISQLWAKRVGYGADNRQPSLLILTSAVLKLKHCLLLPLTLLFGQKIIGIVSIGGLRQ
jgi:hypothetical protein